MISIIFSKYIPYKLFFQKQFCVNIFENCLGEIFLTTNTERKKVTPLDFYDLKKKGEKISILTAYDYPMAKVLDEVGIDALLVGDSMGMVVYGYPTTLPVEIDDILRHTQAVAELFISCYGDW